MKPNMKVPLIALIRELIEKRRSRQEKEYKEFTAFWAEKYSSQTEKRD